MVLGAKSPVTIAHNGADVHLSKNYLKLGNNYGIGFRIMVQIRFRDRYEVMVSV